MATDGKIRLPGDDSLIAAHAVDRDDGWAGTDTADWITLFTPTRLLGSAGPMTVSVATGADAALNVTSTWVDPNSIFLTDASSGMNGAITSAAQKTDDNSDLAMNGPAARAHYGVDGTGLHIGILSNSFNATGGMATDIASGDLPANTFDILDEKAGAAGATDEGRAMAELVHRVAPNASIFFYSADANGETGFATGITTLANTYNCQVIIDDVSYSDEPFYQADGIVSRAVDNVVASGHNYFTSMSNNGTDYYEAKFNPMVYNLPGIGNVITHNVGDGTPFEAVQLNAGTTGVSFDTQWTQPFASLGGAGAGGSAYGIGVAVYELTPTGNGGYQVNLLSVHDSNGVGKDPVNVFSLTGSNVIALAYFQDAGTATPGTFKTIIQNDPSDTYFLSTTAGKGSGASFGHNDDPTANTVGAIDYHQTPAFGVATPVQESFSSEGGGTIYYNANGNLLSTPQTLLGPSFSAPDGSTTPTNPPEFAPFHGTSAAAPDAGAVGALMLQEDPLLTTAQVTALLEWTAISTGSQVFGGAGLINANDAVGAAAVAAVFTAVLNRAVDPFGVKNFVAQLDTGLSTAQLRAQVANGGEAQGDIAAIYQAVLGRALDPVGLAASTQALATTTSLTGLRAGVASSAEAQADIANIYQAVLGRAADPVGLASSTQTLANGASLAALRSGLATSSEGQGDITALYQSVLGRAPDPVGLASSTQALVNGASLALLRNNLATSAEAQSDIANIYQAVLGRPVDPGGLASNIQALLTGTTLAAVRAGLANSSEAQGNIASIYQAVLGRAVDPVGDASSTQALATSSSLAALRSGLATSNEGKADIAGLYQSVLGRAPDAGGLASSTQALATNTSLSALRVALANSGEAQNDLSNIYVAVLGRGADAGGLSNFTQQLASGTSQFVIRETVAGSGEAQAKVAALLQSDFGRSPTNPEIVAGQIQLASGLSLTDLNTQTLMLTRNPTFIAAGGGTFAATAGVDVFTFASGAFGQNVINGFNPANDILQFSRNNFANYAAIQGAETTTANGVQISWDATDSVLLKGVSASSIVPADLRFV